MIKVIPPNDLFMDYLEQELEAQLGKVRPEIRSKFVVQTTDKSDSKLLKYAETMVGLEPPLIRFYLNILDLDWRQEIIKKIRHLITHEVVHVIDYLPHESTAIDEADKINIFND